MKIVDVLYALRALDRKICRISNALGLRDNSVYVVDTLGFRLGDDTSTIIDGVDAPEYPCQ